MLFDRLILRAEIERWPLEVSFRITGYVWGGLTEGFAMVRAGRELGLDIMIGNMMGTSIAMAPASLVGQLCKVVDLDGPIFLKADRSPTVNYEDGYISCPEDPWGYSLSSVMV